MTKTFSMRLACAVSLLSLATTPAEAAKTRRVKGGTAASTVCAGLNRTLDNISKSLAENFGEGVGDENTQRAILRETQYQGLQQQVRMNMDLMRANRCKLPTSVPTGREYAHSAMNCRLLVIRTGRYTVDGICNQSTWKPEKD